MSLVSWIVRKVAALKAPKEGLEREAYYLERALAKNRRVLRDLLASSCRGGCDCSVEYDIFNIDAKIERQKGQLERLKKLLGVRDKTKSTLAKYLKLERQMLEADAQGNEALGDSLRDLMDPIWYQLSSDDRNWLNNRGTIDATTP
jgi:hypothetical protein